MANAASKLHKSVQFWLYKQNWSSLRVIQQQAIEPILAGNTDVLISAGTAAGKTEAFFLPAISTLASQQHNTNSIGIVYISPLKALINDQYRRLERLADLTKIPVTPWHGDSAQSRKNSLKKQPAGILLITPESLESLLIREPGWVKSAFSGLQHIAIDEFHAFTGSERGQHLISLLHRLEHLLDRLNHPIPRTALSATLGDIASVPELLRPQQNFPCQIIQDPQGKPALRIRVQGYINEPQEEANQSDDNPLNAEYQIAQDLFETCRGSNHLVFANSRNRTENLAARLTDKCNRHTLPNEFFPHHGSLSKDLRETLEKRLQDERLPTTAICTMTLELGIDIGKVESVIQVSSPHSVASLRQRLGRSGRRGNPATLRMLITENKLQSNASIVDKLRMELLQSLAMIRLLVAHKWFEPANHHDPHYSTLLHQILATIAQWGGIRADQLYRFLCVTGPFNRVSQTEFAQMLKAMGTHELLIQLSSGELTLGLRGEQISSHYSFYSVFKTQEEYRIHHGAKTLGTLPVDAMIIPDQYIVFAGQRWQVQAVDNDNKSIQVKPATGGLPPRFGGTGIYVHNKVRQEMLSILTQGDYRIIVNNEPIEFADRTARQLFLQGCEFFHRAGLAQRSVIQTGRTTSIIPWLGDKAVNALLLMLLAKNLEAGAYSGVIEVENRTSEDVLMVLCQLANEYACERGYNEHQLAKQIPNKHLEKFDEFLPDNLLTQSNAAKSFDIDTAKTWLMQFATPQG